MRVTVLYWLYVFQFCFADLELKHSSSTIAASLKTCIMSEMAEKPKKTKKRRRRTCERCHSLHKACIRQEGEASCDRCKKIGHYCFPHVDKRITKRNHQQMIMQQKQYGSMNFPFYVNNYNHCGQFPPTQVPMFNPHVPVNQGYSQVDKSFYNNPYHGYLQPGPMSSSVPVQRVKLPSSASCPNLKSLSSSASCPNQTSNQTSLDWQPNERSLPNSAPPQQFFCDTTAFQNHKQLQERYMTYQKSKFQKSKFGQRHVDAAQAQGGVYRPIHSVQTLDVPAPAGKNQHQVLVPTNSGISGNIAAIQQQCLPTESQSSFSKTNISQFKTSGIPNPDVSKNFDISHFQTSCLMIALICRAIETVTTKPNSHNSNNLNFPKLSKPFYDFLKYDFCLWKKYFKEQNDVIINQVLDIKIPLKNPEIVTMYNRILLSKQLNVPKISISNVCFTFFQCRIFFFTMKFCT